jgi:hypothetical protein
MNKYYSIDHRVLFLFGYLFYLITPVIVGSANLFSGYPGVELFQGFFKMIPSAKLRAYFLITLAFLPAFYLGHFVFSLIKPYKTSIQQFEATATTGGITVIGFILCVVLIVFTYLSRNSLLAGYKTYDIGARGKMSTLLMVFNFFLLYQLISKQKLSAFIIAGTAINAVLLLSMGGRLYVIQTLLVLVIYKTSFASKRWQKKRLLVLALVGFLIGGFLGLWRMKTSFSVDKAVYSFLAEPVFTWFSTSTFLISNDIPWFNFPSNFITSFLNLVPNTVISTKAYVVSPKAMGFIYDSPLGADSVWSTLVINFGSIGSIMFMFLTGFLLNFLRHLSEGRRFWSVYYILVCGMLPFQVFRDGFYIVNKQLFFNFLLLPSLLLISLRLLIYLYSTRPDNLNLNGS